MTPGGLQVATETAQAPKATLSLPGGGSSTNLNPFPATITFDREVVGFACAPWFYTCDVNVTNGNLTNDGA
eukprot:6591447-Pyramimonas_sp.AAC.2